MRSLFHRLYRGEVGLRLHRPPQALVLRVRAC